MSHLRRLSRLLVTFGAASAGALLIAGTASAAVVVPLHEAHRDTTAAAFENHGCAQIPGEAPVAGKDGWVFVLPKNDADFVGLTLRFRTTAGATTIVTVPDAADRYPDGITTNGTSKAWVLLPAGWTLLDGSAIVSGETRAAFFNLTHTCPGTPSTSPNPSASPSTSGSPSASPSGGASPAGSVSPSGSASPSGSVSPSTESTPSASASTGPAGGSSGPLPKTGAPIGTIVLAGATTFTVGAALLVLSFWRRRIVARTDDGTVRLNNHP